jgi:hypothetical protein
VNQGRWILEVLPDLPAAFGTSTLFTFVVGEVMNHAHREWPRLAVVLALCLVPPGCGSSGGGDPDVVDAADGLPWLDSDPGLDVGSDPGLDYGDAAQDTGDGTVHDVQDSTDPGSDQGTDPGGIRILTPVDLLVKDGLLVDGLSPLSPVDRNNRGAFRSSPCGGAGLVFRDVTPKGGTFDSALIFAEVRIPDGGTPQLTRETVTTLVGSEAPLPLKFFLYYTDDCQPQVVQAREANFFIWVRSGGLWVSRVVDMDLSFLGSTVQQVLPFAVETDRKGVPHFAFEVVLQGGLRRFIHAWRGTSSWLAGAADPLDQSIETFFAWAFPEIRTGASASVHATYRKGGGLHHSRLTVNGWMNDEVVAAPTDEGLDVARDAAMALGSYDEPMILSTRSQRIEDGSFQFVELRSHTRETSGNWTNVLVTRDPDGYGGNGPRLTGDDPMLAFDGKGRAHAVFSDMVSWQPEPDVSASTAGQIRYGFQDRGTWSFSTLFAQESPRAGGTPLLDLRLPMLAVMDKAGWVAAVGMERRIESDRPAPPPEAAVRYRLVLVPVMHPALP